MRSREDSSQPQALEDEIAELEHRLHEARARLKGKDETNLPTQVWEPPADIEILQDTGKH